MTRRRSAQCLRNQGKADGLRRPLLARRSDPPPVVARSSGNSRNSRNGSRRYLRATWLAIRVGDHTGQEADPRAALIDELEWLMGHGLIDEYRLRETGEIGEVVLSEAAAQIVRDGRLPVGEPGFLEAVRRGPEAARRWLAQEAEMSRRRRSGDRP